MNINQINLINLTMSMYGIIPINKTWDLLSLIYIIKDIHTPNTVFVVSLYTFTEYIIITFLFHYYFSPRDIYKLFVWNECLKNFVCKLKPIIIESYTESNESLKITRLHNPIVWYVLEGVSKSGDRMCWSFFIGIIYE
jgi:hypothetical protein